jgi:glucosyl-3-phosphoglycerate synthase
MSDFQQFGTITTLHRLRADNTSALERELMGFRQRRPIGLVLPSLASEMEGPALAPIVAVLRPVQYLEQVVVALDRAKPADFRRARRFFEDFRSELRILWVHGPGVQQVLKRFGQADLSLGPEGKGRTAWLAFGYLLAARRCRVIALHDCDILTYERGLLARLTYPVANPRQAYEFAKGYYPRYTDKLHGRVARLMFTPLIHALHRLLGAHPLLEYYASFRYPLAGEFALTTDLMRNLRFPSDWGLEIGILAEVYRHASAKHVCQVGIVGNYDHKHQPLSAGDPTRGLSRMAADIAKSLFRILAQDGLELSQGLFKSLEATYLRSAQDAIQQYHDDARINSLEFDRHQEELAVETFAAAVRRAAADFMADPLGAPMIPSWARIEAALPDIGAELVAAVEADNT